jgi:hypothetical protein
MSFRVIQVEVDLEFVPYFSPAGICILYTPVTCPIGGNGNTTSKAYSSRPSPLIVS